MTAAQFFLKQITTSPNIFSDLDPKMEKEKKSNKRPQLNMESDQFTINNSLLGNVLLLLLISVSLDIVISCQLLCPNVQFLGNT